MPSSSKSVKKTKPIKFIIKLVIAIILGLLIGFFGPIKIFRKKIIQWNQLTDFFIFNINSIT